MNSNLTNENCRIEDLLNTRQLIEEVEEKASKLDTEISMYKDLPPNFTQAKLLVSKAQTELVLWLLVV